MKIKSPPIRFSLALIMFIITGTIAHAETAASQATVIPVLCYHRFGPIAQHNAYAVTQAVFAEQLDILAKEQFTPMTVKQVLDAKAGKRAWPAKPVLITVDDGYADFMTYAKPILDKHGYKATLFVYTDFIGSKSGFSPAQLKTLTEEGYEIGSHTKTHGRLTSFASGETSQAHQQRLDKEMTVSKKKIEAWVNTDVVSLAYPYGLWDRQAAAAAQAAGYQLMFTVCKGNNSVNTDPVRWHRTMIIHGTSITTFKRLLHEKPLQVQAFQPAPGARVLGPLTSAEVTLGNDMRTPAVFKTLVAKSGTSVYPVKIDKATGLLRITFTHPWKKGADQLMLTARGEDGQVYRESWLMVVVKHESEVLP